MGIREVKVGFSPQKLALDVLLAAKLPSLLRAHRYDVVHAVEESALIYGGLAGRAAAPLVYDMASSLPEQMAQHPWLGRGPAPRAFAATERWLLERAACVVCSAGLGTRVRALVPSAAVREWRFPADGDPASPSDIDALRRELQLDPSSPIVLYIGNFAAYQGVDLLFEAGREVLARNPDVVLVFAGAARQDEIAAAAERFPGASAQRVRLLQRQPYERVPAFLGLADILVSPRSYGANFPLKLFEYLAAGKAIVATAIEAHTCVLDSSLVNLVPPTARGIAQGITDLLDDPQRARTLAAAASSYAASSLSWSSFKALVEDIYATALARR
jgi:glycosyltransferase involved in cell wall biosynthesis